MRIICLDVGDRHIGVAVSDALGLTAHGVSTIKREDYLPALEAIFSEYDGEVGSILVGLPKMMDGTVGIQGEKVIEFVEELKKSVKLPVVMWDERLSTVSAERAMLESGMRRQKRKRLRDKVAAVIILQNYLDSLRKD